MKITSTLIMGLMISVCAIPAYAACCMKVRTICQWNGTVCAAYRGILDKGVEDDASTFQCIGPDAFRATCIDSDPCQKNATAGKCNGEVWTTYNGLSSSSALCLGGRCVDPTVTH